MNSAVYSDTIQKNLRGISDAFWKVQAEVGFVMDEEWEDDRGRVRARDIETYSDKYSQVRSVDMITYDHSDDVFIHYDKDKMSVQDAQGVDDGDMLNDSDIYEMGKNRAIIVDKAGGINDYLPLTFVQVNNGIEYLKRRDDGSLSCYSLDEISIQQVLNPKAKEGARDIHQNGESDISNPDGEVNHHSNKKNGLMSYCSVLQMNFKEVISNIFSIGKTIYPAYEQFDWIEYKRKKREKYTERVPFTIEERMRGYMNADDLTLTLRDNELLNTQKFIDDLNQNRTNYAIYEGPQFRIPTESVSKGLSNGIPIDYIYHDNIQSAILDAKEKCLSDRNRNKISFLSLLERMDKLFVDSITNFLYQNRMIAMDNADIEKRNHSLIVSVKNQNNEISKCENQRSEYLKKIVMRQ